MVKDKDLLKIFFVGKFEKPGFLGQNYALNLGILIDRLNKQREFKF